MEAKALRYGSSLISGASSQPRSTAKPAAVFAVGLSFVAACGGDCHGCNDATAYPDPAPEGGALIAGALQLRLQDRAVGFYAEHFVDILAADLGHREVAGEDRLVIPVPEVSLAGDTILIRDGCIGDPGIEPCPPAIASHLSTMEIELDAIRAGAEGRFLIGAGGQQRAEITFHNLPVFLDLAFALDRGGGQWVACHVTDQTETTAALQLASSTLEIDIELDDDDHLQVTPNLAEVALGAFDTVSLTRLRVAACSSPTGCDDPLCEIGDCNTFCAVGQGIFTPEGLRDELLAPLAGATIGPLVRDNAAESLQAVAGRPIRIAGQLSAGEWLPEPWYEALGTGRSLWAGAAPGTEPLVLSGPTGWRGVTLAMAGGTHCEQSPCVPTVPIPDLTLGQGTPPFFDGVVEATDPHTGGLRNEAYDAVAMVSESFARQLGLSSYHLGVLCLRLTPARLEELSSGTLVPTLDTLAGYEPLLADLGPPSAPFGVELHPTQPPEIELGSGELIGYDGDGMPLYDSVLQIDLGEVGLSIFLLLDGASYRIATVAADVFAGFDLQRTPAQEIELGVERLSVSDPITVYSEIPGADLIDLGEVLLAVTIGALISDLPVVSLDLSPMASEIIAGAPVQTRINTVRRDGYGEAGFLVAYLTLCDNADLANPEAVPCYARPVGQGAPRAAELVMATPGIAAIAVDLEREHQYRVDGGPWSRFYPGRSGMLSIRSLALELPGEHAVAIRSRRPGIYMSRERVVELGVRIE